MILPFVVVIPGMIAGVLVAETAQLKAGGDASGTTYNDALLLLIRDVLPNGLLGVALAGLGPRRPAGRVSSITSVRDGSWASVVDHGLRRRRPCRSWYLAVVRAAVRYHDLLTVWPWPVGLAAVEHHLRQAVIHLALDRAAHRAGAACGLVPLVDQPPDLVDPIEELRPPPPRAVAALGLGLSAAWHRASGATPRAPRANPGAHPDQSRPGRRASRPRSGSASARPGS
jgi:hypothetical protein